MFKIPQHDNSISVFCIHLLSLVLKTANVLSTIVSCKKKCLQDQYRADSFYKEEYIVLSLKIDKMSGYNVYTNEGAVFVSRELKFVHVPM